MNKKEARIMNYLVNQMLDEVCMECAATEAVCRKCSISDSLTRLYQKAWCSGGRAALIPIEAKLTAQKAMLTAELDDKEL